MISCYHPSIPVTGGEMMYQGFGLVLLLCVCVGASQLGPAARARADDCPAAPLVDLATRLQGGLGEEGVFGVPRAEVGWVFYPVTQARGLPAEFGPDDLVRTSAGSAPQGSMP